MKGLYAILLLVVSNVLMMFAWYGNLKLKEWFPSASNWPLFALILISWGIAFFEYCVMIPANRIGFTDNGGPFSLIQLKIMQEVITLVVFIVFTIVFFKTETFHWNHIAAFFCLVAAVFFAFLK